MLSLISVLEAAAESSARELWSGKTTRNPDALSAAAMKWVVESSSETGLER